jgi:hypothetical protein
VRPLSVALLTVTVALGMPAIAAAGTATSEGGTARFADAAGARENLSVKLERPDPQGWNVQFYSLADPVTWGAGCEEGFVGTICPYGVSPPGALAVDLAGGDDKLDLLVTAEAAGAPTRITVAAGPGNDEISSVRARAEIDGGEGDDFIEPDERTALDVPPDATPGGVIRGGAGRDTVDYEQTLNEIRVSLDGVADDGRPGEGDNVQRDVENVTGSHYGNTLLGSAVANILTGGSGTDRIAGGAGRDSLRGGGGDDTIDALDGAGGDRVECSEGADSTLVDAGDIVAVQETVGGAACERVTWAPAIGGSKLRIRGGRVLVGLKCPQAASRCRGTVRLRSAGGKLKTLAQGSYRIKRGQRAELRLKPTNAGRAAFKRRSAKATAFVQPSGATATAGRAVTVRR